MSKVRTESAYFNIELTPVLQTDTFGLITPDGIKGIKPRLYCDSQMLIYTETGYDKETGEKTQQPLQDALGGKQRNS